MNFLISVIIVVLLVMGGNYLYSFIIQKMSAKVIPQEEFKTMIQKGQLIDVRDKDSFNAGHIMGARNLPYETWKMHEDVLRKDQPILLYDHKKSLSVRAANRLRKKGYSDIYILKGGYDNWEGKTKKKKYL